MRWECGTRGCVPLKQVSDLTDSAQVTTIVARFPSIAERIPCDFVINERGNVEHLTNPIVCHIYIGVGVIHEDAHLTHDVIPCFDVVENVENWSCHWCVALTLIEYTPRP